MNSERGVNAHVLREIAQVRTGLKRPSPAHGRKRGDHNSANPSNLGPVYGKSTFCGRREDREVEVAVGVEKLHLKKWA